MAHLLLVTTLGAGAFQMTSISIDILRDPVRFASEGAGPLQAALGGDGLFQMTSIPGFSEARIEMLGLARECGHFDQHHTFEDGTVRKTIATNGVHPFSMPTAATDKNPACAKFVDSSKRMRAIVDETTNLFATRLTSLLDVEAPLLATRKGHAFDTFADVVGAGEHLEHLHSYSRPAAAEKEATTDATLEMHTDQGLFIAFTPALSLGEGRAAEDARRADPSSFVIKRATGEVVEASLEPTALVFMLGEGIHQVVSSKLRSAATFSPRATPHRLSVHTGSESDSRLWYGRMVLPPFDANAEGKGVTYGEMRDAMNQEVGTGATEALYLGCGSSSPSSAASSSHLLSHNKRALSEPASCNAASARVQEAGTTGMWCWHRCMAYDEFNAAPATCAAQGGLLSQCVNPRDMLSTGGHGDYFPSCTNTTTVDEPYPAIQGSPRPATCNDAAFRTFAASDDATYAASTDLMGMCGASWGSPGTPCLQGKLFWTVRDGVAEVKMAYNGLFGWLATGFVNPGGAHNGMNGGRIVLAMPGAPETYTGRDGLNTVNSGPSVREYIINDDGRGSAFRLWNTPFANESLASASFEANECYTSMTFSTDTIAGWHLNTSGTDEFLWAANGADTWVGYHSRTSRGLLTVDWAAGTVSSATVASAPPPAARSDDHEHDADSPSTGEWAAIVAGCAVVALLIGLLLGMCIFSPPPSGTKANSGVGGVSTSSSATSQVHVSVKAGQ